MCGSAVLLQALCVCGGAYPFLSVSTRRGWNAKYVTRSPRIRSTHVCSIENEMAASLRAQAPKKPTEAAAAARRPREAASHWAVDGAHFSPREHDRCDHTLGSRGLLMAGRNIVAFRRHCLCTRASFLATTRDRSQEIRWTFEELAFCVRLD